LGESAPFWSFVHHLLVQDEAAVAANGFSRIIIVNEVLATALWALVNQALMRSGFFFAQSFSLQSTFAQNRHHISFGMRKQHIRPRANYANEQF
jgi:hypothetical protein